MFCDKRIVVMQAVTEPMHCTHLSVTPMQCTLKQIFWGSGHAGVTLLPWLRLLWCYWRDIDWHLYWHRVLFLTFMSLFNTVLAIPDWWFYGRAIANQQLHSEPLFILGHPRTGGADEETVGGFFSGG